MINKKPPIKKEKPPKISQDTGEKELSELEGGSEKLETVSEEVERESQQQLQDSREETKLHGQKIIRGTMTVVFCAGYAVLIALIICFIWALFTYTNIIVSDAMKLENFMRGLWELIKSSSFAALIYVIVFFFRQNKH